MAYSIIYKTSAEKELAALPRQAAITIKAAIDGLAVNPYPAGCKKLRGYLKLWRIRVGNYRVVYEPHQQQLVIYILRIRDRKDIYA